MGRPKSNKPTKEKLNLSVSRQAKLNLAFLAQQAGVSVSEYVESLAEKEARRVAKRTGAQLPDANQMTIDEVTNNAERTD